MAGVWKPFSLPEYKRPWRVIPLLKQVGRDIKWGHQRIWRGYCDYDQWSIDYWFVKLMPKMLLRLKETRHGSPITPDFSAQKVFLDDDERKEDIHTEWDGILDRMIFLLKEMDDEACSAANPYEDEYFEALKLVQEKPSKMADGSTLHRYRDLADFPEYAELDEKYQLEEKRIRQYRLDCKREFFKLFCTYFEDLWD